MRGFLLQSQLWFVIVVHWFQHTTKVVLAGWRLHGVRVVVVIIPSLFFLYQTLIVWNVCFNRQFVVIIIKSYSSWLLNNYCTQIMFLIENKDVYCPASQAPLARPIGLQNLFSIFNQFAIGENRNDIHPALWKALPLCRLLPVSGSNPSACSASPAPWTWAFMFSVPRISAAASTSPWPWSWFPGGLRDWRLDGQAPAWLQTQGLPAWLAGHGDMDQCTQNAWNQRERGKEDAG